MMRILLTGAAGQLGTHLAPELARRGELITSGREHGDAPCDLADFAALDALLEHAAPQIIVNAAAFTAVDAAEDRPDEARRLNRDVPERLARWCAGRDALLVQVSTDYVFSGDPGRPWREDDTPRPVSVYGMTKREGEQAIAAAAGRAAILRTAWLYSHRPGNFLTAILRRAGRGEDLQVVDDQVGSPTWAGHLAQAVCAVVDRDWAIDDVRVLHAVDRGAVSWCEFATRIVRRAAERGLIPAPVAVRPIPSARWPQKAPRPVWSVLDPGRMERLAGRRMPDLETGLEHCLTRLEESPC